VHQVGYTNLFTFSILLLSITILLNGLNSCKGYHCLCLLYIDPKGLPCFRTSLTYAVRTLSLPMQRAHCPYLRSAHTVPTYAVGTLSLPMQCAHCPLFFCNFLLSYRYHPHISRCSFDLNALKLLYHFYEVGLIELAWKPDYSIWANNNKINT